VSRFLDPDYDRSHYFAKFTPYGDFFNRYFAGITRFDAENYFWTRRFNVGHSTVGILGLNSAWMSGFNKNAQGEVDDYGKLIVGERQVDEAAKRLEEAGDADIWLALLHHPCSALNQDFDAIPVERLLKRRCDFFLRGHLHNADVNQALSLEGETVIIPAGACYDRRDRLTNGYNFVRLDLSADTGTVYLRRYSERRREWLPDMDATGEERGGQVEFALPTRLRSEER
jgi:hypothetical protein